MDAKDPEEVVGQIEATESLPYPFYCIKWDYEEVDVWDRFHNKMIEIVARVFELPGRFFQ